MDNVPFKNWKTVTFFSTLALAIISSPDFQQLTAAYPKSVIGGISLVGIVLRVITTTPFFKGKDSQ